MSAVAAPTNSVPWPTNMQLLAMGMTRCKEDGCHVYVDPVNMPRGYCCQHERTNRARRLNHGPRFKSRTDLRDGR